MKFCFRQSLVISYFHCRVTMHQHIKSALFKYHVFEIFFFKTLLQSKIFCLGRVPLSRYMVPHSVSTHLGRVCHSVLKATTESKCRCHMHGRLQHMQRITTFQYLPTRQLSSSNKMRVIPGVLQTKCNNSWLSITKTSKSQACANIGTGQEFCFCRHNYI